MPESGPRVLVVDDEAQMVGIVAFDLIVLDVMLPGASGVQLCQRIRTASDIPVILLTAKGQEADRLTGLLAGADDYVTKPFSPRELALRASAIVRRTRSGRGEHDELTNGPPAHRPGTTGRHPRRAGAPAQRRRTAAPDRPHPPRRRRGRVARTAERGLVHRRDRGWPGHDQDHCVPAAPAPRRPGWRPPASAGSCSTTAGASPTACSPCSSRWPSACSR